MRAVLLIGHGSLRPGSGAAMIRLAARAREAGVAPIVEAGFLNYSRPRFAQALARCIAQGATEVVVQPYFLIPGKFVQIDLPRALKAFQRRAKTNASRTKIDLLTARCCIRRQRGRHRAQRDALNFIAPAARCNLKE